jgi:diacylglycerol kinase (ATP)
MMARIGVIINPYSKKNVRRKDAIRDKIEKIGGDLVEVRITQSLEEIEEAGRSFFEQGVEIIGICGGDGSMSVTLSRLLPIWGETPFPKIMPLRGGTMNMICQSAGIKKAPEKVFKKVVKAIKSNMGLKTVERDTVRIEGRIGFLFGTGLTSNFLDAYYEGPGTGPRKAAAVALRLIFSILIRGNFSKRLMRQVKLKLRWRDDNGHMNDYKYDNITNLGASTISNLGVGFAPMYRALERPGHMHLMVWAIPPIRMVLGLHNLFFGRPWNNKKVLDQVIDYWEFEAEDPIRYMLDGELYVTEESQAAIEIGPRFKLITN